MRYVPLKLLAAGAFGVLVATTSFAEPVEARLTVQAEAARP